jgi:hypothetical protein
MSEMALGINSRNDSGNVKGKDGRNNFILDKGDRKASLKTHVKRGMGNNRLLREITSPFTKITKCRYTIWVESPKDRTS